MAPWFGFTLHELRRLEPTACETDVRVIWRRDELLNIALHSSRDYPGCQPIVNLNSFSGVRELRLLATQLLAVADEYERQDLEARTEVMLP